MATTTESYNVDVADGRHDIILDLGLFETPPQNLKRRRRLLGLRVIRKSVVLPYNIPIDPWEWRSLSHSLVRGYFIIACFSVERETFCAPNEGLIK